MTTLEAAPSLSQENLEPAVPLFKSTRLESLDIFRGITIAAMLLVNYPGSGESYAPLEHAPWHGWTPTDLIFPFFLFIVGVAMPFSLAKRSAGNVPRKLLLERIWVRAVALFALGELLTGFPFTGMDPVPQGFIGLKIVRIIAFALCSAGVIGILIPWRSRLIAALVPIVSLVSLYLLAIIAFLVNQHSLKNGLDPNFGFGNGILRPQNLRIPGVLQRIGICYGIAGTLVLFFQWRALIGWTVGLFAVYCLLMFQVPFPKHTPPNDGHRYSHLDLVPADGPRIKGSLTQEDNFARWLDETLLIRTATDSENHKHTRWNHAYSYPDNEGLVSTLPAVGNVLIGFLIGLLLRTPKPAVERCAALLVAGVFTTILGQCLNSWLMPINKNIWTPSFTVFTCGVGMLGLGAVFWLADVQGKRNWAWPFKVYGMNAIAAFVVAGMVYRICAMIKVVNPEARDEKITVYNFIQGAMANGVHHVGQWLALHSNWLPPLDIPQNRSLAFCFLFVTFNMLLMGVLYVLKIFVKV